MTLPSRYRLRQNTNQVQEESEPTFSPILGAASTSALRARLAERAAFYRAELRKQETSGSTRSKYQNAYDNTQKIIGRLDAGTFDPYSYGDRKEAAKALNPDLRGDELKRKALPFGSAERRQLVAEMREEQQIRTASGLTSQEWRGMNAPSREKVREAFGQGTLRRAGTPAPVASAPNTRGQLIGLRLAEERAQANRRAAYNERYQTFEREYGKNRAADFFPQKVKLARPTPVTSNEPLISQSGPSRYTGGTGEIRAAEKQNLLQRSVEKLGLTLDRGEYNPSTGRPYRETAGKALVAAPIVFGAGFVEGFTQPIRQPIATLRGFKAMITNPVQSARDTAQAFNENPFGVAGQFAGFGKFVKVASNPSATLRPTGPATTGKLLSPIKVRGKIFEKFESYGYNPNFPLKPRGTTTISYLEQTPISQRLIGRQAVKTTITQTRTGYLTKRQQYVNTQGDLTGKLYVTTQRPSPQTPPVKVLTVESSFPWKPKTSRPVSPNTPTGRRILDDQIITVTEQRAPAAPRAVLRVYKRGRLVQTRKTRPLKTGSSRIEVLGESKLLRAQPEQISPDVVRQNVQGKYDLGVTTTGLNRFIGYLEARGSAKALSILPRTKLSQQKVAVATKGGVLAEITKGPRTPRGRLAVAETRLLARNERLLTRQKFLDEELNLGLREVRPVETLSNRIEARATPTSAGELRATIEGTIVPYTRGRYGRETLPQPPSRPYRYVSFKNPAATTSPVGGSSGASLPPTKPFSAGRQVLDLLPEQQARPVMIGRLDPSRPWKLDVPTPDLGGRSAGPGFVPLSSRPVSATRREQYNLTPKVAPARESQTFQPTQRVNRPPLVFPVMRAKPITTIRPTTRARPVSKARPVTTVRPLTRIEPVSKVQPVQQVRPVTRVVPITTVRNVNRLTPTPRARQSIPALAIMPPLLGKTPLRPRKQKNNLSGLLRQPKGYQPSAYAIVGDIFGRPSKKGILTGLEVRPQRRRKTRRLRLKGLRISI